MPLATTPASRAVRLWAAAWIAGLVLAFLPHPGLQAFGLGLMLPGAGFLAGSFWIHFALISALVIVLVLAGRITDTRFAVLTLWVGGAMWAGWHATTAKSCDLYELAGYFYGFVPWSMSKPVTISVSLVLLALAFRSGPKRNATL